jgi:hypothetical protein
MAHLDFKITSWKRVFVPDDKIQETIEKLKAGDCDEPYDLMMEEGYYESTGDIDQVCEEPLLPSENDGFATQELYDNDFNLIYNNSTKDEE